MTMQPVAALPIDADLWWIVYLRGALVGRSEPCASGVHFDRAVPNPRRDRMVICRRDGGTVSGVFDRPRITLDVWAKTEQDATNLASLIIALALKAPGVGSCVRVVHASGPSVVADPSGDPRRLCSIETVHRATTLAT